MTELCPGCSQRYQNPDTGLCDVCMDDRLQARYAEEDRSRDEIRRLRWRERQRRHRERESLRPREPLGSDADPLDVTTEALEVLTAVRSKAAGPTEVARLDELEELIRQLGWGPEQAVSGVTA